MSAVGGTPRESHQEDPAWIGSVDDQMRDARGERVRLSRAGPGDHEERGAGGARLLQDAMLDESMKNSGVEQREI
jgi:hypothetical protein